MTDLSTGAGRHEYLKGIICGSQVLNRLDALVARWSDEKEYEDWSDYDKAIRESMATLSVAVEVIKVTKRPLGAVVKFPGIAFGIHIYSSLAKRGFKPVK